LGAAVLVYVAGYGLLAARRVFGDSWVKTIAKALVVAVGYSFCLFFLSLVLLAYALTKM
jgi:hypothetical protein